jgi:hypothetical protein
MQLPWQTVAPALGCQIGFAASLSAESSHGWPAHIAPQRQRRRQGAAGGTHYIRAHSAEDSIAAQKDDHANRGCDLARRSLLATAAFAAASVAAPGPSTASKLPEALDRAWEGLGGGPADLVFPGGASSAPLCLPEACGIRSVTASTLLCHWLHSPRPQPPGVLSAGLGPLLARLPSLGHLSALLTLFSSRTAPLWSPHLTRTIIHAMQASSWVCGTWRAC